MLNLPKGPKVPKAPKAPKLKKVPTTAARPLTPPQVSVKAVNSPLIKLLGLTPSSMPKNRYR